MSSRKVCHPKSYSIGLSDSDSNWNDSLLDIALPLAAWKGEDISSAWYDWTIHLDCARAYPPSMTWQNHKLRRVYHHACSPIHSKSSPKPSRNQTSEYPSMAFHQRRQLSCQVSLLKPAISEVHQKLLSNSWAPEQTPNQSTAEVPWQTLATANPSPSHACLQKRRHTYPRRNVSRETFFLYVCVHKLPQTQSVPSSYKSAT